MFFDFVAMLLAPCPEGGLKAIVPEHNIMAIIFKNRIIIISVMLVCCIIASAFSSYAAEPVDILNIDDGGYIGRHIEYINEKDLLCTMSGGKGWCALKQMPLAKMLEEDSVNFASGDRRIPFLIFGGHAVWVRFRLLNASRKAADMLIELDKHLSDKADLFVPEKDSFIRESSDFTESIDKRKLHYKNPVFDLRVKPGLSTYYMRLESWWIFDNVPLRLWQKDSFYSHVINDNLFQGLIAGIFILIFIYNIVIYFSVRGKVFIFLSSLIITMFVIHMAYSGFGFRYLWPGCPEAGLYILFFTYALHFIFNLLFCRSFVETAKYTPRLDIVLKVFIIISAGFGIGALAVPDSIRFKLYFAMVGFDNFYYFPLIFSCITAIRRGNRNGAFLLVGLGLYFLSQAEWMLSNMDIIPYNLINYLQVKGSSYIILMTLGLAFNIRKMKASLSDLESDLKLRIEEKNDASAESAGPGNAKSITDITKIKIETVKDYLHENYRYDISREGLSSVVDMSPDHLSRMFRQYTGVRMSDYVNRIRVEEAVKKLKETDDRVIDIAFETGFGSLRTFNDVFMKITGNRPSDYRK
ncbi:MAG: helix-turn-helix domain-containing protein [Spirochaetes bacterium]|nr:helix-turn-helix domain-containing protein [Spirochaetota bacterium]